MAFIEEELDDLIAESYWEEEAFKDKTEKNWSRGYHIDQTGRKWKLKEMELSHLFNTIKYFKLRGFDVSKLEKQLNKR